MDQRMTGWEVSFYEDGNLRANGVMTDVVWGEE